MKQKYEVVITETLEKIVTVEAETAEDAVARVSDAWKNTEYLLEPEDFQGVEFSMKA